MAAFAIVRDSETEAKKELARITQMPATPPKGFDNFEQWLSGTELERELKLQEYSVSNRGLRPNLVGTPEQIRERIEEYEAAGLDLLLLQMSPQAEEMDRFAAQVIAPIRTKAPELVGAK
jgi:FMNH2-dependent dimethyl sulfone monooxygenase